MQFHLMKYSMEVSDVKLCSGGRLAFRELWFLQMGD